MNLAFYAACSLCLVNVFNINYLGAINHSLMPAL